MEIQAMTMQQSTSALEKPPKRIGRRLKLTKTVMDKVAKAVSEGATMEAAAMVAGVSPSTLFAWLKKGRNDADSKSEYADLLAAVDQAEALSEIALVARVQDASKKDWRAAAFLLERRFPQRWGRNASVQLSGPDGGPIEVNGRNLTDEELVSRIAAIAAKAATEAEGEEEGEQD